jgi:hypothetical protein
LRKVGGEMKLRTSVLKTTWIVACSLGVLSPVGFCEGMKLDSSHIILHLHGSDTFSYLGNSISCIGDVNHDGYSDIAISSASPFGTLVFYGGNPPDTVPDLLLKGGVGPATAVDLDGDGINDIVTSAWYGSPGNQSGVLYFFHGYHDSIATVPFDSIFPPVPNYGFGFSIRAAYLESSARASILTSAHNVPFGQIISLYKSPLTEKTPDWTFQTDHRHMMEDNYGFIDFNGDGHLDIFVGLWTNTDTLPGSVLIFFGPSFGATPDRVIGPPPSSYPSPVALFAEDVSNVGDVDGDGWSEFAVNFDTQIFIYKGGPGSDTTFDYLLQGHFSVVETAGDVNGDESDDLIGGEDQTAPYGGIRVYLGGPKWDVYSDGSLGYYDLPFWSSSMYNVGYRVASAGDFNGDGIGDLMFSCQNDADGHPGDVFVVKGGADIKTGIAETLDHTPHDFTISQNFPNPFNPSTQIRFSLPTKSATRLAIYNVFGQVVKELVNEQLTAGTYTVNWDGCSEAGIKVASGVYLYRLEAGNYSESKKMVLIK